MSFNTPLTLGFPQDDYVYWRSPSSSVIDSVLSHGQVAIPLTETPLFNNPQTSSVYWDPSGGSIINSILSHSQVAIFPFNEAPLLDNPQPSSPITTSLITTVTCDNYLPLATSTQQTVDNWMVPVVEQNKIMYKCTWPNCTHEPLTKGRMRTHVFKHLGIAKLYKCSCGKQFSSIGTVKRHINTQKKKYYCGLCPKQFARKDYRNFHRQNCLQRLA